MISFLSLQTEVFKSPGYKKFVTQKGGSMDLLMCLAPKKAQSLTFTFNNSKIKKIISIERRKELINETVQKLRERLIRWRKFTRTTLDP